MSKNMNFRQWLKEYCKGKEWKKELKQFVSFPIWETIIGMLTIVFSAIWIAFPWYITGLMLPLQIVAGIMLALHAHFREKYTYSYHHHF